MKTESLMQAMIFMKEIYIKTS